VFYSQVSHQRFGHYCCHLQGDVLQQYNGTNVVSHVAVTPQQLEIIIILAKVI
jgi:hypothetical protein